MLKIDSNMTIKMSRGDDVRFPLFLNQGSRTNPIRYEFVGENATAISFPATVSLVEVNLSVWKTMVSNPGEYVFIYNGTAWTLHDEVVDLDDYGISIIQSGELVEDDKIHIMYQLGDGCEVYFNIYHLRQPNTKPIFTKTFTSDRDLWKGKRGKEKPNGDMKIELLHTDPLVEEGKVLEDIPEGEYVYQIKAKVKDILADDDQEKYVINVVTNRLKLFIIDDDYSEREW